MFKCLKRCGVINVICGVLVCVQSTALADRDAATTLAGVRSANAAIESVFCAQRKLCQFDLDVLRRLNEQGNASWLEVAQKEADLALLAEHCAAMSRFDSFVHSLEREAAAHKGLAFATTTAYAARLPGSNRLFAWLEVNDAVAETTEVDSVALEGGGSEASAELLERARKLLTDANAACSKATSISEMQRTRALLQRDLLRARWQLLRLQHDACIETSTVGTDARVRVASSRHLPSLQHPSQTVTALADARLTAATGMVARAEAFAHGRHDTARIEWQRQKLNLNALEQLFANGLSAQSEVRRGRESLRDLQGRMEQELARTELLMDAYRALDANVNDEDKLTTPAMRLDDTWSPTMLYNSARLGRLLELRRQWYCLNAVHRATSVERSLKAELLRRLREAQTNAKPYDSDDASIELLQATLDAAARREIASVQLSVELLDARLTDLGEQIATIPWEEARFVAQCEMMDRSHEKPANYWFTTQQGLDEVSDMNALPMHDVKDSRGMYYVESQLSKGTPRFLRLLRQRSDYAFLWWGTPELQEDSGGLGALRWISQYHPTRGGYESVTMSVAARRQSVAPALGYRRASFAPSSVPRRFTVHPATIYPFGALRSDLRSQLPPGHPPWYLPGSPTNLR